jgi:hypothetical protein
MLIEIIYFCRKVKTVMQRKAKNLAKQRLSNSLTKKGAPTLKELLFFNDSESSSITESEHSTRDLECTALKQEYPDSNKLFKFKDAKSRNDCKCVAEKAHI